MSGKFDAAFSNETVDANSSVKHGGNLLRINSRRSHRDCAGCGEKETERECNEIAVIK